MFGTSVGNEPLFWIVGVKTVDVEECFDGKISSARAVEEPLCAPVACCSELRKGVVLIVADPPAVCATHQLS